MNAYIDETRPRDGADAWSTPLGLVTVTAPSGVSPYYRMFWGTPREQTSGGRTFAKAWRKALEKEAHLEAGATALTEQSASVGIAYWLDPKRPTPRGGWGASHRKTMSSYAEHYFYPVFGKVRMMDLRRSHIQKAVNAAPTYGEGTNVRRAASSLLAAMRQGDFLLDSQVIDLKAVWWHGERPSSDGATAGEQGGFVPKWKRPSNAQVRALRKGAEETGRGAGVWWRGLMVELAAYSGVRWSELIALTVESVHAETRKVDVVQRVEAEKGKGRSLVPPKMSKKRTTLYPEVSPTGYQLDREMRRRIKEVRKEQRAGSNLKGLLFPSEQGDWMWTGNFHRDIFEKAALAAGWPYVDEEVPYGKGARQQRKWDLVWHSLRHTFCTVALDEWGLPDTTVAYLAGHGDTTLTRSRYVDPAEDSIDAALRATAAGE